MPRAKQRTPELRDRVLQVALDTLAAEGVAGLTTRRVAGRAQTSTPAVYELFGDKAGLVREVFFEGFRMLQRYFDEVAPSDDARADLLAVALTFRRFVHDNPVLADVMFARPFSDFDPGPDERRAGAVVQRTVVGYVRRAIDAGIVVGHEGDIAHALVALTQGLAAAESSQRLGTSRASVDRRWSLAVGALLDGLAPSTSPSSSSPPVSGRRRS